MLTEDERRRKALAPASPQVAAAQQFPTDVSPKLRRDASLYAPVTNYMQGNDAAAGKLVDNRLQRAGGPMPSQVGPPSPTLEKPPTNFGSAAASFGRPHATLAEAAKPPSTVGSVLGRAFLSPTGQAAVGVRPDQPAPVTAPAAARPAGVQPQQPRQLTAGVPAPAPLPRAPAAQGGLSISPAAAATPAPARQLGAISGAAGNAFGKPNAAAPGQVALSERTQQPLPGSPKVGANGEVVYDDNWQRGNKQLVKDYETRNGVQTVMPGAGVAASTVGGELSRAPRAGGGFTREDRMAQLDGLARLGATYRRGQADDSLKMASLLSKGGHFRQANDQMRIAGGLQTTANDMTANPMIGQLQRADPAELALRQQELTQQGALQAEQIAGQQIQNAGARQSQKQQQQMMELQDQLIGGDPAQKAAAAQTLASLQGVKQGQPIKLKRSFDTGQVDPVTKAPVLGEYEVLVDWNGNELNNAQPGQQGGGAGAPVGQAEGPDGVYDVFADGSMKKVQK